MTNYQRVIPRDLFNEGNLLKCLGRVYINLEKLAMESALKHDGEAFEISQDQDSGALIVLNVTLRLGKEEYTFYRPLNSRYAWPLKLRLSDDEEIDVFNEDSGEFSTDMLRTLAPEVTQ